MTISTKRKTKSKMMLKSNSISKSRKHLNKSRKTIKTKKRLMKGGSFSEKFRPPSFNAGSSPKNQFQTETIKTSRLGKKMTPNTPSKKNLAEMGSRTRSRFQARMRAAADNSPSVNLRQPFANPQYMSIPESPYYDRASTISTRLKGKGTSGYTEVTVHNEPTFINKPNLAVLTTKEIPEETINQPPVRPRLTNMDNSFKRNREQMQARKETYGPGGWGNEIRAHQKQYHPYNT